MPFTKLPPKPPRKLPPNQVVVDTKTGILTPDAQQHEVKLERWRDQLTEWATELAASVP